MIKVEENKITVDEFNYLYDSVGWGHYENNISAKALASTLYSVSIYDNNKISPTKLVGRLPVMIITGDIPALENTNDKDTQIVVDIEYTNMQDPSRSFKMKGAAMRPQGTSSMGYPKKNFRIYTQKLDNTVLEVNSTVVKDKLYSFKDV